MWDILGHIFSSAFAVEHDFGPGIGQVILIMGALLMCSSNSLV